MTHPPLLALLALLPLAGCAEDAPLDVPSGTFVLASPADTASGDGADPNQDLLVLDIPALHFEIRPADGSAATEGALSLMAEDVWLTDCYTNVSHSTTKSYALDADAVTISGVTVAAPVLSAKCGGRPLMWPEGEVPDEADMLVFDELPAD